MEIKDNKKYKAFIDLLQIAVGNKTELSAALTEEEWTEVYNMAKKQSLVGICFYALKKLPAPQRPQGRFVNQWGAQTLMIMTRNQEISTYCGKVTRSFKRKGFDVVILKGQGNKYFYPEDLGTFRNPGDIDAWVIPSATKNEELRTKNYGPVRSVIEFCQKICPASVVNYHHLEFPVYKKVEVEVHYRPTWLFCPWRNRTLQRWFQAQAQMTPLCRGQEYNGFDIPSVEFNLVFQLLHIYKHIFEEGIGLRQLLDYYWCLCPAMPDMEEEYKQAKKNVIPLLKKLGVTDFAGAVMYVLHEIFGLKEEFMLCKPLESKGRELMEEIFAAGNFGKYDERYNFADVTKDMGDMHFRGFGYGWTRLKRNLNFIRSYPTEVLCEPLFRVYHLLWRKFRLWKY